MVIEVFAAEAFVGNMSFSIFSCRPFRIGSASEKTTHAFSVIHRYASPVASGQRYLSRLCLTGDRLLSLMGCPSAQGPSPYAISALFRQPTFHVLCRVWRRSYRPTCWVVIRCGRRRQNESAGRRTRLVHFVEDHVRYDVCFTDLGQTLVKPLFALCEWAAENCDTIEANAAKET